MWDVVAAGRVAEPVGERCEVLRASFDVQRACDRHRAHGAWNQVLAVLEVEVDDRALVAAAREVVGENAAERGFPRVGRPANQHTRTLAAARARGGPPLVQHRVKFQIFHHRRLTRHIRVAAITALNLEGAATPRKNRLLRAAEGVRAVRHHLCPEHLRRATDKGQAGRLARWHFETKFLTWGQLARVGGLGCASGRHGAETEEKE